MPNLAIETKHRIRTLTAVFASLPILLALACSDDGRSDPSGLGAGGSSSATGGGKSTGGLSASGGSAATGGSTNTGGATTTGGSTNTGGATTTGGSTSTGGATNTGGATTTGGSASTGGITSSGGSAAAMGGSASTGGATTTGGSAAAMGGSANTGGITSSGGSVASGGAVATGGMASSGGSETGPVGVIQADITVAADGSGDYRKVQEAVNAANPGMVILIKPGTYKEQVKVSKSKISLVGESYESTIITGDKDAGDGRNTHATVIVSGEDFYAEQITIQNTVDSRKGGSQAEALNVSGDRAIFYRSKITGFQDTYRNSGSKRSYHKECIIEGTTDFIYGNGIALFEDCTINNRKDSHVTAANHSLKDGKPAHKFGYVFRNCSIKKHPDETVTNASLGRPWGNAARVVYLNSEIGAHIRSDGWMEWNGRDNHQNSYYAEYKSTGPGAQPDKRLSWTHQLTDAEAATYTTENIFKANSTTAASLKGDWVPQIPNIRR